MMHMPPQLEQEVEQRNAELRASEERFRILVEGTRDYAIFMLDPTGHVVSWNLGAERLNQYSSAEIIGRHFSCFYPPEDIAADKPARELRTAAAAGKCEEEGWRLRKDGTRFWASVSITALRDDSGTLRGYAKVTRDLTERKRAEESRLECASAARMSQARLLAAIVESSDDAIVSKSLDGIVQSWNAAAERLFGHTAQQAIGRHISLIIPPERGAEEDQILQRLRAGERIEHFETVRMRSDGRRIDVSLTISPLRDETGHVVGASKIARDITARKRAEEALRDNEERLRLAMQTGRVGVWEWDIVHNRVTWTDSLYQIHGLRKEEFSGTVEGFAALVHPDDLERVNRAIGRSLADQAPYELELRIRKPNGEVTWVFTSAVVTRSNGQAQRMVGATVDITQRKRAEEALQEADRRKDEFLATLAHELRNPLAPIRNAAQLLKGKETADPDIGWAADVINRQAQHMARLLDDLLDVARISRNRLTLRKARVNLATVVHSAIETSRPLIDSARHELSVSLPPEPIYVDADAVRLGQVISNLLNNAAKYMETGGRIDLRAEQRGAEVVLSVRDQGIGISRDMLPRLFEMFAQASDASRRAQGGAGIGLSLARGLVQLHGGRIDAHSDGPGKGSEFIVYLPVSTAAPATPAPRAPANGGATVGRRVLVVDDLQDNADSMALLLKMMGHEAHTVYDGESAIAAAERLQPDAVLLDIGLPHLSGYEVCERLRQAPWGKKLYVIALTGWGQKEDRRRTEQAGFDRHLVKPVDPAALAALLDALPRG
jgi:hypothetical protein